MTEKATYRPRLAEIEQRLSAGLCAMSDTKWLIACHKDLAEALREALPLLRGAAEDAGMENWPKLAARFESAARQVEAALKKAGVS